MNVLLITYDLKKKRKTPRPDMAEEIQGLGSSHTRLSESCYVIVTSKSIENVYDALEDVIDEGDNLHVATISAPWIGHDKERVTTWMKENLPPPSSP